MAYRDPDTGKFITEEKWEALQEEQQQYDDEDYEDLDGFEAFDEEETY